MGTVWCGQCERCRRHDSFLQEVDGKHYCHRCLMGYNGPPPKPKPYSHYVRPEELIARIEALDAVCAARRRGDYTEADRLWDAYWRKYKALDGPVDLRPSPPPPPPPKPRPEFVWK